MQHPNGTTLDRTEPQATAARTVSPLAALRAIAENKPGVPVNADLYEALGGPELAEYRAYRAIHAPAILAGAGAGAR
jgi:hypothetical protein